MTGKYNFQKTGRMMVSTDLLRRWAIGMGDGMILSFALSTGIFVATQNNSLVIDISLVMFSAAALLLGLGGYFAEKNGRYIFSQSAIQESDVAGKQKKKEIEETRKLFGNIGLDKEVRVLAEHEISVEHNRWNGLMQKYNLYDNHKEDTQPARSAINISLSYITGSIIPVIPFFFFQAELKALQYSIVSTLICLFIFGYLKNRGAGANPLIGAIRMTLLGALAAGLAMAIAQSIGKA